jgi:hypothetical protein
MCTNILSDEEMTKIKVVDLDEYYNFYFHYFFSSNNLVSQKCCLKLSFLEIQIFNCSNKVTWKMTKIKVIDLDKLYNFYVHDFSFEIICCFHMLFQVSILLKFKF